MKDLLKKFENKEPEIIFNWKDAETEAEGWTVINSLRGGAAGGDDHGTAGDELLASDLDGAQIRQLSFA